jgi:hypothetical protein
LFLEEKKSKAIENKSGATNITTNQKIPIAI